MSKDNNSNEFEKDFEELEKALDAEGEEAADEQNLDVQAKGEETAGGEQDIEPQEVDSEILAESQAGEVEEVVVKSTETPITEKPTNATHAKNSAEKLPVKSLPQRVAGGVTAWWSAVKKGGTVRIATIIVALMVTAGIVFGIVMASRNGDTTLTVPSAPQNFVADSNGDNQVSVTWSAPADNGGSEITGFYVSLNNGEWVSASSGHTFYDLTNGILHTFRVRAVNAVGNGSYATATITLLQPPDCEYCDDVGCVECQPLTPDCSYCDDAGCEECEPPIGYDCGYCNDVGCIECDPVVPDCSYCNDEGCIECDPVIYDCDYCNDYGCIECQPVIPDCNYCNDYGCIECQPIIPDCSYCNDVGCAECLSCENPACDVWNCVTCEQCSVCNTWNCTTCVLCEKIGGCGSWNCDCPEVNLDFFYFDGTTITGLTTLGQSQRIITIPANVTAIGQGAFQSLDFESLNHIPLQKVIFESGSQLEIIEDNAFLNSLNLTSIRIPAGVVSIGAQAFSGWTNLWGSHAPRLESLTFEPGSRLEYIGMSAFSGGLESRSSLTHLEIPASVRTIGARAFSNLRYLTTLVFEEGSQLVEIGANAFSRAISSESITIPASVTSIGWDAFAGIGGRIKVEQGNQYYITQDGILYNIARTQFIAIPTGLSGHIVIPHGIMAIPNNAFLNAQITSIVIPASVATIGSSAFSGATNLSTVTFEEGSQLATIGGSAFRNATALTSITVLASVVSIGWAAFAGLTAGQTILVQGHYAPGGWVSNWNGGSAVVIWSPQELQDLGGGFLARGNTLVRYIGTATNVVIPNTITAIGANAFRGNTTLVSVTVPASVLGIGELAFMDATNLTSINVAAGNSHFVSIDGVLYNIGVTTLITVPEGIASVTIPASVTSIGSWAFQNATSLTSITIPVSVTWIGNSAFAGLTAGQTVLVQGRASRPAGWNSNWNGGGAVLIWNAQQLQDLGGGLLVRGNTLVRYIGTATNVVIPNIITAIEASAFSGNTTLVSITIPAGVTSIGSSAFSGATALASITIPAGVTSIGNHAFRNATALASITIPASVTSIGSSAFAGLTAGQTVLVQGRASRPAGWNSNWNGGGAVLIWNAQQLQDLGGGLLARGNTLVRYIGTAANVVIPNIITAIGENAFRGNTTMVSVTIPASVTSIGNSAFWGWTAGQTIFMQGRSSANPPAGWANRGGSAVVVWNA